MNPVAHRFETTPIDGLEMMQLNLVGFDEVHSMEATK